MAKAKMKTVFFCKECGYETYHFAKPELAIEAWNRRAGEEDKHEPTG